MSAQFYNIYPPIKKTKTMNQITVSICELKLFEYVRVACVLYDLDNIPIENRIFTIDSTNGYNEWNNDDAFIINWVKKKLQEETNN